MDLAAGVVFLIAGIAMLVGSTSLAVRWRRRDERKADERRNLDWSQSLDAAIFRFLGITLIVVGALFVLAALRS